MHSPTPPPARPHLLPAPLCPVYALYIPLVQTTTPPSRHVESFLQSGISAKTVPHYTVAALHLLLLPPRSVSMLLPCDPLFFFDSKLHYLSWRTVRRWCRYRVWSGPVLLQHFPHSGCAYRQDHLRPWLLCRARYRHHRRCRLSLWCAPVILLKHCSLIYRSKQRRYYIQEPLVSSCAYRYRQILTRCAYEYLFKQTNIGPSH